VSITAIDSSASEIGSDPASSGFTRTGSTTSALTVTYTIAALRPMASTMSRSALPLVIPAAQQFCGSDDHACHRRIGRAGGNCATHRD
jgi:hypothetical protein